MRLRFDDELPRLRAFFKDWQSSHAPRKRDICAAFNLSDYKVGWLIKRLEAGEMIRVENGDITFAFGRFFAPRPRLAQSQRSGPRDVPPGAPRVLYDWIAGHEENSWLCPKAIRDANEAFNLLIERGCLVRVPWPGGWRLQLLDGRKIYLADSAPAQIGDQAVAIVRAIRDEDTAPDIMLPWGEPDLASASKKIDALAKRMGVSRSMVVRRAIILGLDGFRP